MWFSKVGRDSSSNYMRGITAIQIFSWISYCDSEDKLFFFFFFFCKTLFNWLTRSVIEGKGTFDLKIDWVKALLSTEHPSYQNMNGMKQIHCNGTLYLHCIESIHPHIRKQIWPIIKKPSWTHNWALLYALYYMCISQYNYSNEQKL